MPGILYCAQALKNDKRIAESCDTGHRYFNLTVQDTDSIAQAILDSDYDLIGFSSYCWNIEANLVIAAKIKDAKPATRMLFGGPEVLMRSQEESDAFFARNPFIDCIAFGESERKIAALAAALLFSDKADLAACTGFAFAPAYEFGANFDVEYVTRETDIPSAYPFEYDIPRTKGCGLAMVYESGRGCPYQCIYCQFGHRNHKPFRFDLARVEKELVWLFEQRIDCIHFADAVFDLQPQYAKDVLNIILRNNIATSTFFYCSFYKLDEELAGLFSAAQCQIGVGIQSTSPQVLHTIRRSLSPRLFEEIGDMLGRHAINFYTDLIFGLPGGSLASFKISFNQTLRLEPTFVMPFPLTLIKGTPLGDAPETYGVRRYDKSQVQRLGLMCDIEYENIGLSEGCELKELETFDDVALAMFYFYNRFPCSLSYLQKRLPLDSFSLFAAIGSHTKDFLRRKGQIASNTNFIDGFQDEIFSMFSGMAAQYGAAQSEQEAFGELFKLDIFRLLMLNSPLREKIFRTVLPRLGKRMKSIKTPDTAFHAVLKTYGKIITIPYRLEHLLSLAQRTDAIEAHSESVYVHAPFEHWNAHIMSVSPLQRFCIEFIPFDRPVRARSIIQAALRHFNTRGSGDAVDEAKIRDTLAALAQHDIILMH
jgi:radical SAM superfamily enzyme YgiQ (UPF0313 family)